METNQTQPRAILINGFAINMLQNPRVAVVEFRRISLEELRELALNARIINFIRHQSTVQLVSSVIGKPLEPNSNNYVYSPGDVLILITLAAPQRGQELAQVKPEDLVIYLVSVRHLE